MFIIRRHNILFKYFFKMNKQLYNKQNKKDLIENLNNEDFKRITLSFYKYIKIINPLQFRDKLYSDFIDMNILGRVYIAAEGINAQMSIPDYNESKLKTYINSLSILKDVKFKNAVQEGISFYKLTIKIKNEIVAYKLNTDQYDMDNIGCHLDPVEFNKAIEDPNSILVDIRNHYESEIGHFKGALVPDVERSQELLPEVKKLLEGKEDKKILLYCTGGIRCEKASSYLIKNNYKDVNQLDGGVINYAHQVKMKKIKSKYFGKNFVFDDRLGERITQDDISKCHQCNNKSDSHKNCSNHLCHLLFIQCQNCDSIFSGCCSQECADYNKLTEEEKACKKKSFLIYNEKRLKGKVKPKLYKIIG